MVDYDRSQLKCLMKVLVCGDANRRVLHNHNIVPLLAGVLKTTSIADHRKMKIVVCLKRFFKVQLQ